MRRFFKKIKLLIEHSIFLWKSDCIYDWDYNCLLEYIVYKINRMHKFNSGKNAVAIHSKQELKRMKEVVGHLQRYSDIYKYVEVDDLKPEFVKVEDELYKLITWNKSKRYKYQIKRIDKLEKWHLQEAFRKMSKYIESWWD